MDADFERRKASLKERNAQLVYFRSLREKGFKTPESLFCFIGQTENENWYQTVRTRLSERTNTHLPSKEVAQQLIREWLANHAGTVLLYVYKAGTLQGSATDFLQYFDYFSPLVDEYFLLATPGAEEILESCEFERDYLCRVISP